MSGFVLNILVVPSGEHVSPEDATRLAKLTCGSGNKDVELLLPERTDIVHTGWLPEFVHETRSGEPLSLTLRIRPDNPSAVALSGRVPEPQHPGPEVQRSTREVPAGEAGDEVLYEVTFQNREVRVNGFRLSRPNFNSENEVVFDYLFRHPNRRIELAEIESVTGRPLTKKLREIVRDLGFRAELREIFFPGIAKTAIEFVNPVTRSDFLKRELRPPRLDVR